MVTKIKILSAFFILFFGFLIARLSYWQILKSSDLASVAKNQHSSSIITSAPRGSIVAPDGSYWTVRMDSWDLIANTTLLKGDIKNISQKLSVLLSDDEVKINSLLSKNGTYIPIKQRLSTEVKNNVEALKIPGLTFETEESRFYPEASSSAQLLGFVGKDDNGSDIGYFGLEGYYNLALSGKSGYLTGEKDAKGSPILINGSQKVSAISGVNLVTSIDKRIQLLAERKLKEGIEKYGAKGGSVTIMDPYTGQILAMTSLPSFDPSKYWTFNNSSFKNPVISNSFEPGSIFKVLVVASGLDANVIQPDTECDICGGPLKIDKYEIKTWNNKYTENINMTDVIVNSDNVGMSFIGQKLGKEKMYDYLDSFGIGKITGVDLQGESAPAMRKKGTWNDVDLVTSSFGQGIAVTGIAMVRAVSAIANGGHLVTPRVVTNIKGDGWSEKVKSNPTQRIISSEAAAETAEMMYQAVERGEAKWTKIPGFKVAGKTGTAQIPVAGHYDSTNTNHSFVGFAPLNKPKFVMLVTLLSPQSSPWAAETAAPLWFSVARELFPYLGISPD